MKNIWLVQRGTILSPLAGGNVPLSKSVRLDYMGSAEFEFGALPESLRRLQANKGKLHTALVYEYGENPLRVLSYFGDEDLTRYTRALMQLWLGKTRTKERPEFANEGRFNFWWDIENDVIFSFHKEYMKRLPQILESSWRFMDQSR